MRAAALPAPPSARWVRLLPSRRSFALGLLLLGLGAGAYVGARETSVFAVRELDIAGGSPSLRQQVRKALAPEGGRSLVKLGAADVERRLTSLPGVLSATSDRAFPHTLRVVVTPERPVLLLRRGSEGWIVSARGRVVRRVADVGAIRLPRVFVPRQTGVRLGELLPPSSGGLAAIVVAPLAAGNFPAAVRLVRTSERELTLVLRTGVEVRLGDVIELRLKLAVARRILGLLAAEDAPSYIDVSVPERPVVGDRNPQVATTA